MESPFIFGKKVKGKNFINRTTELKRLKLNFISGINTMIIAPRRWGKSSLVMKASEQIEKTEKNIRICYIDLFRINNEKEFYEELLTQVVKSSSSRWEDWFNNAKNLLKGLVSSFSIGVDPYQDFKFKLNWEEPKLLQSAIIDLPEKLAKKKKLKFIICIDEFQKIAEFPGSLSLQQKLRSSWQSHEFSSYCLFGSKFHIINELFSNPSMPFYQFGDLMYLEKIPEKHWYNYISRAFRNTGKEIKKEHIDRILYLSKNHPFHVQQFSHHVWRLTERVVDDKVFAITIDELLRYNAIFYERMINSMSLLQINFLRAIAEGETQLTSAEVIKKYELGTSGNIETLKKAVVNKEIVSFLGNKPEFEDPLFKYWFTKTFLNN